MRSWARGYRCGVFQFVKSGKWKVGEAKAAAALGGIDWEKMGDGWSWLSKDLDESADMAREGWARGQARDRRGALRVPAARRDHLPDQVGLDRRRRRRRDAARPARLPARRHHRPRRRARADRAADLVSEVVKVKHPMDAGHPRPAGDRVVEVLVILDGASEPLGAGADVAGARAHAGARRARRARARCRALRDGRRPGCRPARRRRSRRCSAGRRRRPSTAARSRPPPAGSRSAAGERAWRVDVARRRRRAARGEAAAPRAADGPAPPRAPAHTRAPPRRPPPAARRRAAAARARRARPGLRVVAARASCPPRILDERRRRGRAPRRRRRAARGCSARASSSRPARPAAPTPTCARRRPPRSPRSTAARARVVVHVGAPDEAAHERDAGAQGRRARARSTRELIAPLARAVRAAGGTLTVCPDHGCDPATGAHDATPSRACAGPAERTRAAG